MVKKLQLNSYAKLNLHLAILNRRSDGFHSLVSFFHLISLHDEIAIEWHPDSSLQIECEMEGALQLQPEKNIAYQAALLFLQKVNRKGFCRIFIKKKIPSQAGLGGGSSDAATVLLALNQLTAFPLEEAQLYDLALKLGSDVPFFIKGSAALVEGRGEVLTPLAAPLSYPILVVVPPIPISTKEAFLHLDAQERKNIDFEVEKNRIKNDCSLSPSQWSFYNSFQPFIEKEYPVMKEYRKIFLESGASFASLSGSGSAIFGIYEDETKREQAMENFSHFPLKIYREKLIANSSFMM